jgi:hypothetical protein
MYDPITKWVLRHAGLLLIISMFFEAFLLPLSVMNIIMLALMSTIVFKLFYNENKEKSYRSLSLTL